MKNRIPNLLVAAALMCLAPRASLADGGAPLLTASADGAFYNANTGQDTITQFFLTSPNGSITIPIQSADGNSASGTVAFGALSGTVYGAGPGNGLGAGQYTGNWDDILTVTSTTLEAGTPVNLLVALSVDTTTTCSGSGTVLTTASFSGGGAGLSFQSAACNTTFNKSGTALISTAVGSSFEIEGELDLSAEAVNLPGSASVDPSSGVFIDSETPGASYTTASGTNYETPTQSVPEPSLALLLASGLLALVGLAKWSELKRIC